VTAVAMLLCIAVCYGNESTTPPAGWQLGKETKPPPPAGWQLGKTLTECNRYMLDHQLYTDVTFQFVVPAQDDSPQSILIHAHEYVLTSRSIVFEEMLLRQHRVEDRSGTTGNGSHGGTVIKILDVDPGIFKEMLM